MIIQFTVSNFLSLNEKETVSMVAGKARKHTERINNENRVKLNKCKVIFGANASGKSNLISAFEFMQYMVVSGLPRGFSNKYFRLNSENKNSPSEFEIQLLCDTKVYTYGFTIIMSTGSILTEYLYEISSANSHKVLYERDTISENFVVGSHFKHTDAIAKLMNYGEDSVCDKDTLFLSIINANKGKMYADLPELQPLRKIFEWFKIKLNISFPESILTGYPYFTDSNLTEIAELLNALGTGVGELRIVEVPIDVIKAKMPDEFYNNIISDLEKANARTDTELNERPRVMVRAYKEFYTFEIDAENNIKITTIESSHENKSIYFSLSEESDGTARLLDLIEIYFEISNNQIFVIDEIDRCLHPAMTVKVIELFLEMAERRHTQLIFTSHESRLLAADFLRNDEICFVCKNTQGASIVNPLERYQLRADKKVYAALFDGTIDAIPIFNENKLKSIIHK